MAKVLIVDDTADMVRLMQCAVEDEGYEVVTAYGGHEALQLAATTVPDVLLLDVMMPELGGLDVLRILKGDSSLRRIPVILVTAKGDDEDVIAGLDAGAHDYVTKPFKKQVLAARVRSAIRGKQDHDRLRQLTDQLRAEMSRRQRMEHELARAHKLESIGHLAAGIAHEINTPAQYIGDNLRFLQQVFADVEGLLKTFDRLQHAMEQSEVDQTHLSELEAAMRDADVAFLVEEIPKALLQSIEGIEHIASIVRTMKEFSHPGNGCRQAVDMNRIIQTTLAVSRNEWKYVARVVTEFAEDLPPVFCLPAELNQVILNLVVNAAQAMNEVTNKSPQYKGTLTIRTRRDGDWVELRVEDTGCGIPEDIREHVFDHFFTTKEVGSGTGQGLAIAHSIVVEKHGGSITFESEVGRGTVFVVRLPLSTDESPLQTFAPAAIEVSL